jgi:hypothetical protein
MEETLGWNLFSKALKGKLSNWTDQSLWEWFSLKRCWKTTKYLNILRGDSYSLDRAWRGTNDKFRETKQTNQAINKTTIKSKENKMYKKKNTIEQYYMAQFLFEIDWTFCFTLCFLAAMRWAAYTTHLLSWCSASQQPKHNGTRQPRTETKSQNHFFLFKLFF